jgi:predicted MFS family arabinose efflux permease
MESGAGPIPLVGGLFDRLGAEAPQRYRLLGHHQRVLAAALIGLFAGVGIGAAVIVQGLRRREAQGEPRNAASATRSAWMFGVALATFSGMAILGAVTDSGYVIAAGCLGAVAALVGLIAAAVRWRRNTGNAC